MLYPCCQLFTLSIHKWRVGGSAVLAVLPVLESGRYVHLKSQASDPIWPQKRRFTEDIRFYEKTPEKSYLQSKILKGNTFDMFPPFLHCLAQKRSFESGRYVHLKSQIPSDFSQLKTPKNTQCKLLLFR